MRRMLRDSAAISMQPHRPVPIESRALGTLSYIRASIDAASSLAVPGMAGIVMGCIGIAATVLASLPPLSTHWLALWLVAAVAAAVPGAALMARQATQRGSTLLFGPFKKFLMCLCPALLAGAVLTFVFWRAGQEQNIPGTWLLLYGCAVISASTVTSSKSMPLIATMGAVFIALGGLAFALPAGAHNLLLGAGFGVVHFVSGILIGRANQSEVNSHGE
jgi:hypothetical protein